jgi:hypothetical protein
MDRTPRLAGRQGPLYAAAQHDGRLQVRRGSGETPEAALMRVAISPFRLEEALLSRGRARRLQATEAPSAR